MFQTTNDTTDTLKPMPVPKALACPSQVMRRGGVENTALMWTVVKATRKHAYGTRDDVFSQGSGAQRYI